jgi:hypothetical protein
MSRENQLTAYKTGQFLEELSLLLERHGLTRAPLDYRSSISRPRTNDRTDVTFEERVARLPRRRILDALADIANDPELLENPADLVLMRSTEILLVAGFRIGELFTAPKKFLVREPVLDEGGNPRLDARTGEAVLRRGLRYWPEKGGEPYVKWLNTVVGELVERAVADLDRLCSPARDCARWLEQHPGEVNLQLSDDVLLSLDEVAMLIGVQGHGQVRQWFNSGNRGGTGRFVKSGRAQAKVKVADLKRAMATDRYDKPVVVRSDGKSQTLSESFFVSFQNSAHRKRGTNRFIAVPFSGGSISDFLGGRRDTKSVFERYNYRTDDGERIHVRTHDFRRLVNVIFQRGGLSQAEIARWMGRRHIGDNAAYDLRTPFERAEEMRGLIQKGEVIGIVADQYKQLQGDEADLFLNGRVTTVQATPNGNCLKNMAELPCPVAIACLNNCMFFARVKNDTASRIGIEKVRSESLRELERAKAAEAQGIYNAENWRIAHETVVSNATRALAIDDDPEIQSGSTVQLNPGGKNRGKPIDL